MNVISQQGFQANILLYWICAVLPPSKSLVQTSIFSCRNSNCQLPDSSIDWGCTNTDLLSRKACRFDHTWTYKRPESRHVTLRQNGKMKMWGWYKAHIAVVTTSMVHIGHAAFHLPSYLCVFYLLGKHRPYIMSPLLIKFYQSLRRKTKNWSGDSFVLRVSLYSWSNLLEVHLSQTVTFTSYRHKRS